MSELEVCYDEKSQINYLKHIDHNTNNIRNIDYVPEQFKGKKCIVN